MTVDRSEQTRFADRIRHCARMLGQDGVDALGPLYDVTAARLLRYALALTRNRDDAEDAVQAAMVRVALKPKLLAGAEHPWAYFLRIVRNEALTIVQCRKPAQLLSAVIDPGLADPPSLVESELKQTVRQALAKLPAAQSEVVVLKIWEEMTFLEIGEVLRVSPNTAASRYRYALEKLTGLLHSYCEVWDV